MFKQFSDFVYLKLAIIGSLAMDLLDFGGISGDVLSLGSLISLN